MKMSEDRARQDAEDDMEVADARSIIVGLAGIPGGIIFLIWYFLLR